jgi:heme exporter protein D
MDFGDYLIWKAVGVVVLVFLVNLVFSALTGKSIEEVRRDRQAAATRDQKEGGPER